MVVEEMTRPLYLDWPDKRLNPNARIHWLAKAQIVADARNAAFALARNVGFTIPPGPLQLNLIFYPPPDKRRRDMDNVLASCKAALDGIFRACDVDDANVCRIVMEWGGADKAGTGCIYLTVEPLK